MNWFRPVGLVALAWRSAARLALRGSVWAPLLLLTTVHVLVGLVLLFFHHPALVTFAGPWVEALGGEGATHYPTHLFALPAMFRRVDLVMTVLIAPVAMGVAILRFAAAFGLAREGNDWRRVVGAMPSLALLTLIAVGAREGLFALTNLIPEEFRQQSIIILFGLAGIRLLILVVLQSFLAFAAAWVVVWGRPIGGAIRDSIRMAIEDPLSTFLLVAVPAGLLFPVSFVLEEKDFSESDLSPEVVVAILAVWLVARLVLTFLGIGSITRLFVWRLGAGR